MFNANLATKCLQNLYRDFIAFFSEDTKSYYKSNYENGIYVERVNVEGDHVNFIYQHMRSCKSQDERMRRIENQKINNYAYIRRRDTSCTYNIIGLPTTCIDYERLGHNGGCSISISSCLQEPNYINSSDCASTEIIDHTCVDFEFQEAVYPIRVSIHEVLNPGRVTEIWARDSDRWFLLWTGGKQFVRCESRVFSPALRACDFKTKMLRLILPHYDYRTTDTRIDAVELIGTSELIQPKDPKQSLADLLKVINRSYPDREDMHNFTPDYKTANLDIYQLMDKFSDYCIMRKSNLRLNNGKLESIAPSPSEFKEHQLCDFSQLPDEMILKILEYLDLRSLCLMSITNKRFNDLTRDLSLFKYLNIQDLRLYNESTDNPVSNLKCKILSHLESRCEHLKQLDLVKCIVPSTRFITFLKTCGSKLTSLRLSFCNYNNDILCEIGKTCKNLTVLNFSYCVDYDFHYVDEGLLYLQHLNLLEQFTFQHIEIPNTQRSVEIFCKILQGKHRLRYLHLNSKGKVNLNAVIIKLRDKALFSNLETIKLSSWDIDSPCIAALAEFKNLRMLSISKTEVNRIDKDSWRRLFSSCRSLETVFLPDLNGDINEALTQCKNLKDLRFRTLSEIPERVAILEQFPELHIHVKEYTIVDKLREKYPHASICVCDDYIWDHCIYQYSTES
ncbi:PREDICTED: uncharacterized protein LOC105562058 isoform X2 [Vollenhovia emeryi]|uniref:uncharacterized protein LOC105562058 isoform X2 n=1 Tax=Vollenhovia emeryi TaxID=411798 RepID=UPI0005F44486|nr:PREDICTED: uncharacterized protein LOC105562058 isoform X2 [Vollenhovia emeryi]